jgi:hypothetical protein
MTQDAKAVMLGRARLNCHCHVCAFFNSRDDEYDVLLSFMKEGFDAGDNAIHILDGIAPSACSASRTSGSTRKAPSRAAGSRCALGSRRICDPGVSTNTP